VQCLSEIFERAVKREILEGEIALPDVPPEVLAKYPGIPAGIQELENQGFPVLVKDALQAYNTEHACYHPLQQLSAARACSEHNTARCANNRT
jgi:hypothetical protein